MAVPTWLSRCEGSEVGDEGKKRRELRKRCGGRAVGDKEEVVGTVVTRSGCMARAEGGRRERFHPPGGSYHFPFF